MIVVKHHGNGLYLTSINHEAQTAAWDADLEKAKKYENIGQAFTDWYTVSRCPDRKLIQMTVVEEGGSNDPL